MASLAVVCSIRTANQQRKSELLRSPLSQSQMTSLSKGAPIYYMTARVAFKKKKVVHERVLWVVSVFDNANDIRSFAPHVMHRIEQELYGRDAKSEKHIIIREILSKKFISHSNLTFDEHKRQHQTKV
jgi:hypothetical protein